MKFRLIETARKQTVCIQMIFMWKEKDEWHFQEIESESDRLNPEPEELNVLLKGFSQDNKREKEFRLAIGK